MDSFGLSKVNRLFWLGRYLERTKIELQIMQEVYDQTIDGPEFDYRHFCELLEIPNTYESSDDFVQRFLFDDKDPYSVISSLNCAYDNAIVLRETITSQAMSYIQMAANMMDKAACGIAPMLEVQTVSDYLYAFRGCIDDSIRDNNSYYTLRCGASVENISLSIRLEYQLDRVESEFIRLEGYLRKTYLRRDGKLLKVMFGMATDPDPIKNRAVVLDCVENLFLDV